MSNLVELRREGATTEIMINRPDRRNALDHTTLQHLLARIAEVSRDPATHVIVLHGAGEGFCSGADLDLLAGL
ncbi:MAG: enoyl-CoA hydratase/isomerase family protein, partial [Acidobacteriota bacterium]